MTYNPTNPNGQATSANSSPVVVASDQSAIDTNYAKVAGTATSTGNGATDAGTQRVTISNNSTGQIIAQGNVASAATDSGNPVKVGGKYNSTPPTFTDGQRGDLQLDSAGSLKVNVGTVSISSNSSVNVAQIAGTTTDTNSGLKSAGTQRVVLATDQPQLTNALKVDGSAVTQPVSGTVTANAGTNLNTSALALETGGNLATAATNTTGLNNTVGTAGLAIPTKGIIVQGSDGTNARAIKTDTSGNVNVNVQGTLTVDTELPAAAALADSTANPTVPTAGSAIMIWDNNGSTWNRQRSIFHGQNATGTGIVATGAMAEFDDVSPSTVTENQFAPLRMSSNRNLYGTIRDAAGNERGANVTSGNALVVDGSASTQPVSGTVAATQSGTWTVQPGNTANTTSWNMNLAPSTTGGWSVSSQTNLTTTATVSAAAGKFAGYMFMNLNSTPAYIQVFDTTGAVTLGTTTPTFVVPIPANSTAANGAGANLELTNGIAITSGIKVAATTTPTGATTVTTGLTGFVLYK